jgi:aryl-alcohol dehydrogenase-like predicted oxidoreductase
MANLSGLVTASLGVGTNAWGTHGRARPEVLPVFRAALKIGVGFFDTAEVYGRGGSERTLGLCLEGIGQSAGLRQGAPRALVLSKFFPMPWRLQKKAFLDALRASLGRLRIPFIDVYLIHFPLGRTDTWVNALGDAVEAGLARAVGVSNFSASQMRRAHDLLARRGIPLACNEVEYSLLRREPERNGTLAACRELGATMIAYRPLALGLLTQGSAKNPSRGWRRLVARGMQGAAADRLRALLQELGDAHGGKTGSQVALNWVQRKGALPIPGATSVAHLEENAGSLGWALTDAEVLALDAASLLIRPGRESA